MIVDTEHGNIADDEMHIAVGTIASQGVSPMVRIPAPENWIVKRTLDTGGQYIEPHMLNIELRLLEKPMRYFAR